MAQIEDFYISSSDGDDWLPAITRAQDSSELGFTLEFGPHEYYFSDTIRLVRSMHLVGAAGKLFSTVFRFAPDKGGIHCGRRFVRPTALEERVTARAKSFTVSSSADIKVNDTLSVDAEQMRVSGVSGNVVAVERAFRKTAAATHARGTVVSVVGYRSDTSIIERITLRSGGGTSPTAHGITMEMKVALRDLAIAGFPGDGIHIEATLPTNAINWEISNVQVNGCGGDGLSVAGSDAGYGYASLLVCQDNAGWAIRDHSAELGNTYVSCVAEGAGNGFDTTPPTHARPRSVFINCDVEVSGMSNVSTPTMVINSRIPNNVGNAVVLGASAYGADLSCSLAAASPVVPHPRDRTVGRQVTARLGYHQQLLGALSLSVAEGPIDSRGVFTGEQHAITGDLDLLYDYQAPGWWGLYDARRTGSPLQISTGNADVGPAQIWCEMGIFLGQKVHITADGSSRGAPLRAGRKSGDIAFNTDPQADGYIGWVWITPPGSVGSWKRFGKIEP